LAPVALPNPQVASSEIFKPPLVTELPTQFPFVLLARIEFVIVTLPPAAPLSIPSSGGVLLLPDIVLLLTPSVPLAWKIAPPPLAEVLPEKVLLVIVAAPLL
jgi:hypothetical protein